MPDTKDVFRRQKTRPVRVGSLIIGGDAPIRVQSMCNTPTIAVGATVRQIKELESWGCELVRVAVNEWKMLPALGKIKSSIGIPLIADIHYDWQLAVAATKCGIDKLRINPGNIGPAENLRRVARAVREAGIPLRLGLNAGSLKAVANYRHWQGLNYRQRAQVMVREAEEAIRICEEEGLKNLVISLKSFEVPTTILAYKMLGQRGKYPFHLGITEAGTLFPGALRSALAFGALLSAGIGDTIRVSLSAPPREEVRVGYRLLKALGLRQQGIEIVACPTCGRSELPVISLAGWLEKFREKLEKEQDGQLPALRIAVMGCAVNGPGEARDADFGVAGAGKRVVFFRKGKTEGTMPADKQLIFQRLEREIRKFFRKRKET